MPESDPNYVEKSFFLLGVKAAILNGKNEILLLQRSVHASRPGGWDLPGGTVGKDESPEDAVIREVLAQTGIELSEARTITSDLIPIEEPIVILGFGATVDNPRITLSQEYQGYEWVPIDELGTTELPGPYQQIVHAYVPYL